MKKILFILAFLVSGIAIGQTNPAFNRVRMNTLAALNDSFVNIEDTLKFPDGTRQITAYTDTTYPDLSVLFVGSGGRPTTDSANFVYVPIGVKFLHYSGGGGGSGTFENFFLGYGAGQGFTGTGYANTVIGRNAAPLLAGVSPLASSNVIIGYGTASALTTGTFHTILGTAAGKALTTQTRSTFLGYHSGRLSTSSDATAVGAFALEMSTSASGNTAVGTRALQLVTSGGFNTAMGWQAGNANTGEQNSFFGYNVGGNGAATGGFNSIFGCDAGRGITSGAANVMMGRRAGYMVTTGSNNIYFGNNCNLLNSTGSSNILIGTSLETSTPTAGSELAIAKALYGTSIYSVGAARIGVNNQAPSFSFHVTGTAAVSNTPASTSTSDSVLVKDATTGQVKTVAQPLSASEVLDFPSTSSNGQSDLTMVVVGAVVGDVVALGIPNASTTNGTFIAWVSATDVVTVRFHNTSSVHDPASGTFKVKVLR